MLAPDNFLYFITVFTVAICGGTYLLFAYYRDKLVTFNAVLLFLCAIRACTEFYLPTIKDFETATNLAIFQSLVITYIGLLEWYLIWFYVRPLRGWRWERLANQLFLWGSLLVPIAIRSWWLLRREVFYFHEAQIDGYWQFAVQPDFEWFAPYTFHTKMMGNIAVLVLLVSIIRNPRHRIRQSLLLAAFVVIPYYYFQFFEAQTVSDWTIPNAAGIATIHSLIISWFISDYRIFRSNFEFMTKDLLDSISDIVIATDRRLKITHFNRNVEPFLQPRLQHLVSFLQNYSSLSQKQLEQMIDSLLTQQQSGVELVLKNEAEEERIFSLKSSRFQKGETLLGYTFLLTDLTKVRQQEAKLQELNTTKDRLFAIIGHDLRKPALAFRGIGKKVNFLLENGDFKTLYKLGEQLEISAFRLNSLLDNLLNWALHQRNVLPHHPKNLSLYEVTLETVQLFQSTAAAKDIQLLSSIAPGTSIFADAKSLNTILRNLLDNAIKFTPPGGCVWLRAETRANQIVVIVQDEGSGLTGEQIALLRSGKIQQSTPGTADEKGAGLGLSLVQELLELHDAGLDIQSQPGKGTTFRMTFLAAARKLSERKVV